MVKKPPPKGPLQIDESRPSIHPIIPRGRESGTFTKETRSQPAIEGPIKTHGDDKNHAPEEGSAGSTNGPDSLADAAADSEPATAKVSMVVPANATRSEKDSMRPLNLDIEEMDATTDKPEAGDNGSEQDEDMGAKPTLRPSTYPTVDDGETRDAPGSAGSMVVSQAGGMTALASPKVPVISQDSGEETDTGKKKHPLKPPRPTNFVERRRDGCTIFFGDKEALASSVRISLSQFQVMTLTDFSMTQFISGISGVDFLVALLNWIEFWAVGWEIDQPQTFTVSSQEGPYQWAFMPRGIIHPNHNARILLQKPLEKTDEFPLIQPRIE